MCIEDKAVKQAWADVVVAAKFFLSCFGLVGANCVLAYNLNMFDINFPKFEGRKS